MSQERIIYVIPYTSIIDQTAEVFKQILGESAILESHCNVSYDFDEETMPQERAYICQKMKLASENWDVPIVVTTNEQFFESLFSNKSSKCRKLHNIASSVIIMDECQMLPVEFLTPTLRAIEELVSYYRCTAVLCSATQPRLEKYLSIAPKEIMPNIQDLYNFFERVSYNVDGQMTYQEIEKALENNIQSLCVATTIKEANEIYRCLQTNDHDAYYLSTRLCPEHRKKVIQEIKERLRNKLPCHVVSTSIISVGVDVDFPVAYLQYSGLDSLIQGAGRCNREGKRSKGKSFAHVFWTEKSQNSHFMSKEKQASNMVMNYYTPANLAKPEAIDCYYRCWYKNNESGMDVEKIVEKSNDLAFADIAKAYHLIPDKSKSVIIPYNEEAREIICKC